MHEAATHGRAGELQQLIKNGAPINTLDVESRTPLHVACFHGQTQCVQVLLEAGACVNASTPDGSTPLCDACVAGKIDCVKLLLEYGAKVNPPVYGFSPLHDACNGGNPECVRLMIEKGAYMEDDDWDVGTPLHVACARQNLECVRVLLNAGANVNAARIEKMHETGLHIAAEANNLELIELLVEFGGNVFARDYVGKTPIHYASHGSAVARCLKFYETEPLSLQHLCRLALRTTLGKRALEAVPKLGLPNRMIRYLTYTVRPELLTIKRAKLTD